MTQTEIEHIWNYYLSLENDLSNTSRYIEPSGQENVYSFEFSKLIILSCTEIEAVLKTICKEKSGKDCGNIGEYKGEVLSHFPKIVNATVYVSRWWQEIHPFKSAVGYRSYMNSAKTVLLRFSRHTGIENQLLFMRPAVQFTYGIFGFHLRILFIRISELHDPVDLGITFIRCAVQYAECLSC